MLLSILPLYFAVCCASPSSRVSFTFSLVMTVWHQVVLDRPGLLAGWCPSESNLGDKNLIHSQYMAKPIDLSALALQHFGSDFFFCKGPCWRLARKFDRISGETHREKTQFYSCQSLWHAGIREPYSRTDLTLLLCSLALFTRTYWLGGKS